MKLFLRVHFINSDFFLNSAYLIANTIINSALGYLFWYILSSQSDAANIGIGSAISSISMLISSLANLGFGYGVIRFIPLLPNDSEKVLNSTLTICGLTSILFSLVFLSGTNHWAPNLDFIIHNIYYILAFVFFNTYFTFSILLDQMLVAGRSGRHVLYKNVIINFFKLLIPYLFVDNFSGINIFLSIGFSSLIGVFICWVFFMPQIFKSYVPRPLLSVKILKLMINYSLGNYIATIMTFAPGFIYPLMVLNYAGPEISAYFYIAWMTTMFLSIIPNGISLSFLVEGSHDEHTVSKNCRNALILSILIAIPGSTAVIFLGKHILNLFGPNYSQQGMQVVPYLAIAIIPQCINSIYQSLNQIRKKIDLVMLQASVTSLIAIFMGWILLRIYGPQGIGMAYALAHFLVSIVVIFPLFKILRAPS